MHDIRRSCSVNVRDVPQDTKDAFKAYCAARGMSMREAIIHLMEVSSSANVGIEELHRRWKHRNRRRV